MNWWTLIPYKISPYLIQINGYGIRYYSLMYILAFAIFCFLIKYRLALVVDGLCVLRYDNETGKGDHRHIREKVQYSQIEIFQKTTLLAIINTLLDQHIPTFYFDAARWGLHFFL